jgi:hypothetical protein
MWVVLVIIPRPVFRYGWYFLQGKEQVSIQDVFPLISSPIFRGTNNPSVKLTIKSAEERKKNAQTTLGGKALNH